MKFQHLVGLLVLAMIGGCAWQFGAAWSPVVWGVALTVFLILALSMIAPKLGLALIENLSGIIDKVKSFIPFVKKDDPPTGQS